MVLKLVEVDMNKEKREHWGSKLGVVLAVAGSAVGLGNFLRFPAKATLNGGGAFMIPYFIAFLLLGIPLMWVEWTLGRMGGERGHGTSPAIFDMISRNKWLKYIGILGILGPFIILCYYIYIESWTLAYAYFSITGKLSALTDQTAMRDFLAGFQGLKTNEHFDGLNTGLIFFALTIIINFYFIYKGISGGIEKLSRYGMPLLIILGIILAIRVLTLGTPDANFPDRNVCDALSFVWKPDFSQLLNSKIWLEAAGQIFFTLSVGIGVILTYASYLTKRDDIALSGLTAAGTNEFCEVVLGGSIVIPAAFIFLGAAGATEVAARGIFDLGFVTMPLIFKQMPAGQLFSTLWFLLLFIAGITSSVSLIQPMMSFAEDEFGLSRKHSALTLFVLSLLCCLPAILFLRYGFLDELDFWGGTMFLIVFATIEVFLFAWVLGIDRAWDELHAGAAFRVPKVYKFITRWITPTYLLILLSVWTYQAGTSTLLLKNVPPENVPYIWGARVLIVALWIGLAILVHIAWRKKPNKNTARTH